MTACPYCAAELAREPPADRPRAGAGYVVPCCAKVAIFTEALQLRPPEPGEVKRLPAAERKALEFDLMVALTRP